MLNHSGGFKYHMGLVCYPTQQHRNPTNGSCQPAEEEEVEEEEKEQMVEEKGEINGGQEKLAHLA